MRVYVLEGRPAAAGRTYRWRGARGSAAWPTEGGAGLGTAGMWNVLWRLGMAPVIVPSGALPAPVAGDLLCVHIDGPESSESTALACRTWLRGGGRVLCSGRAGDCPVIGGTGAWRRARAPNPYSGLAARLHGAPVLIAPASWPYERLEREPDPDWVLHGDLASVGGERQTPSRSLIEPLAAAPAAVQAAASRMTFLNGSPFAAFQAWLQGQEDLQPWLHWRHRLFWLDEFASALGSLLHDLEVIDLARARTPIPALPATTIVLRHDVDYSRDTSYLAEEGGRGLVATHAVLNDPNARFWARAVAAAPGHEAAFHYTTASRDWPATLQRVLRRQSGGVLRAARSALSAKGLTRQIARARATGIPVETLHRHLAFLPYPELVDTLDAVYRSDPALRGSSSFFRAHLVRWGQKPSAFTPMSVGEWPDSQFPLWLPFRLAHAADGGRLLRGWETTSVMEPEAGLVAQMLAHRVPHITQRVITLNFHPAHAQSGRFAQDGSLGVFKRVLDVIRDDGAAVRTLRDVYAAADAAPGQAVA